MCLPARGGGVFDCGELTVIETGAGGKYICKRGRLRFRSSFCFLFCCFFIYTFRTREAGCSKLAGKIKDPIRNSGGAKNIILDADNFFWLHLSSRPPPPPTKLSLPPKKKKIGSCIRWIPSSNVLVPRTRTRRPRFVGGTRGVRPRRTIYAWCWSGARDATLDTWRRTVRPRFFHSFTIFSVFFFLFPQNPQKKRIYLKINNCWSWCLSLGFHAHTDDNGITYQLDPVDLMCPTAQPRCSLDDLLALVEQLNPAPGPSDACCRIGRGFFDMGCNDFNDPDVLDIPECKKKKKWGKRNPSPPPSSPGNNKNPLCQFIIFTINSHLGLFLKNNKQATCTANGVLMWAVVLVKLLITRIW